VEWLDKLLGRGKKAGEEGAQTAEQMGDKARTEAGQAAEGTEDLARDTGAEVKEQFEKRTD
jgi:hypothetical protein